MERLSMYHLNSKETCWHLSLGIYPVPKHLYQRRSSSFMKNSFDHVDINAEHKESRKKLIQEITIRLQQGMHGYQEIRDSLLESKQISFEKRNDENIFYVSRSSLSNYILDARKVIGIPYIQDKTRILEMFDAGLSRPEIEIKGFNKDNIYSVLKRNGRIEGKYKKGVK